MTFFYTGEMPPAHSYFVEGIGEDFLPSTINLKCMDDIVQVTDQEQAHNDPTLKS